MHSVSLETAQAKCIQWLDGGGHDFESGWGIGIGSKHGTCISLQVCVRFGLVCRTMFL